MTDAGSPSLDDGGERYLDLIARCLTREIFLDQEWWDADLRQWPGDADELRTQLRALGWRAVRRGDPAARAEGRDWPPTAETMVGTERLDNVAGLCRRAIEEGVAGDFIETGVWRGGVTILMRAVLAAYGIGDRRVWVADSFEGLPVPDPAYPADEGLDWSHVELLKVDADTVRANFERYGLWDEQVCLLEGWFADTLDDAPIDRLAVLRLDGDLFGSTMDALEALYPKMSPGGFVIVDDYGGWESCRAAVDDYRSAHGIDAPIQRVDWTGVWWQVPA
ncbi:MAG: class I SAM-dependent methyltransferase [Microthrixaceae bacterium]|nr:class I SAM-dependent methyltransferase [Microthrixaceae bacterium]